ncbi:hypothetical protein HDU98_004620 [Podochytrium sp. JEL0797]|nr:hypothetical protein HDU98_004620 [Podochytrium sp. JEL0797]
MKIMLSRSFTLLTCVFSSLSRAGISLDIQPSFRTFDLTSANHVFNTLSQLGVELEQAPPNEIPNVSEASVKNRRGGREIVVNLENHKNLIYFVNVTFGTPPQPIKLILDTGSNQLWVGSETCQHQSHCKNLESYNPLTSTTFKDTTPSLLENITYGSGFVQGSVSTDVIHFANMTLDSEPFLLVSNENATMQHLINGTSDGIMGLAFVGGLHGIQNTTGVSQGLQTPSIIVTMIRKGLLKYPMFSIHLRRIPLSANAPQTPGGTLTLGSLPSPSLYSGEFTYFPVSHIARQYYWSILAQGLITNLDTTPDSINLLLGPSKLHVIIDTGTSFISIDNGTFSNYTRQSAS